MHDLKRGLSHLLLGTVLFVGAAGPALGARDMQKTFDQLTSAEKTAAKRAAKKMYEEKSLKKLVVTGSMPGEGKTTTAAGLAIALSQAGQRVILVDTDLRRPTLHKLFQVSNSYGITGLLLSRSEDPKQALMATPYENLMLLPSGPVPANPADLLMSPNWQHLTDKLSEIANYVIFDTPPVLSVSDASILAGRADGTILVAEAGRTRRNAVRESLSNLGRTNSHVVGLVKNKIKPRKANEYYYYEYGSEPEKRRRRGLIPATVVVPSGTPDKLRPASNGHSANGNSSHSEEEKVA